MTYFEIDRRLHWMSQILARINRSYVPEKKDNSHLNLGLDIAHSTIMGRWINVEGEQWLPMLDLDKFVFKILGNNLKKRFELELDNQNMDMLQAMVGDFMKDVPLSGSPFKDPLPYQIPDYSFQHDAFRKFSKDELDHWMHWRSLSKRVIQDVLSSVSVSGEVRIWPDRFNTGIKINASDTNELSMGLAMGDELSEEAYFYITAYRSDDVKIPFKYAPELRKGTWITQGDWKGAILPIDRLNGYSDLTDLQAFIFRSMEWLVELDVEQGFL
jgi:hypothetical protein